MTAAVEKYYSVAEVAMLLSLSRTTVLERMRAGALGAAVNLGSSARPDYRLPASGVNAYIDSRRLLAPRQIGIAARSEGELRRRAGHRATEEREP